MFRQARVRIGKRAAGNVDNDWTKENLLKFETLTCHIKLPFDLNEQESHPACRQQKFTVIPLKKINVWSYHSTIGPHDYGDSVYDSQVRILS